MNIKRMVIGISLASMLVVGAGAASAQRGGEGDPGRGGPSIAMPGQRGPIGDVMRTVSDIITEETGLTARELMSQMRDGATLAEVIEANGGDVESVQSQVVTAITEEINEAVADERLTQERADVMLESLEQRVADALNGEMQGRIRDRFDNRPTRDNRPGAVTAQVLELAAEQTGLTTEEIREQMADGATFGDVLRANGVDIEAFADEVIAQAQEQHAARDAERFETARERLLERLNQTGAADSADDSE